jgi:sugar phosphate isomerase/epimerase
MIGLGSYCFYWQNSELNPNPPSLIEQFEITIKLGLNLFQICDYRPLLAMSQLELEQAALKAQHLNLAIELGTRGLEKDNLLRHIEIARVFDAKLIRSMVYSDTSRPSHEEAIKLLSDVASNFEVAGIRLALETYEEIATRELVEIVLAVGSPNVGICLDPGNVVARLEDPKECVEVTANHVFGVHIKDFSFERQPGWVGFTFSGSDLGTGLLDYEHLARTTNIKEGNINQVIEHWTPWQGSIQPTIDLEKTWTKNSIQYLRRRT